MLMRRLTLVIAFAISIAFAGCGGNPIKNGYFESQDSRPALNRSDEILRATNAPTLWSSAEAILPIKRVLVPYCTRPFQWRNGADGSLWVYCPIDQAGRFADWVAKVDPQPEAGTRPAPPTKDMKRVPLKQCGNSLCTEAILGSRWMRIGPQTANTAIDTTVVEWMNLDAVSFASVTDAIYRYVGGDSAAPIPVRSLPQSLALGGIDEKRLASSIASIRDTASLARAKSYLEQLYPGSRLGATELTERHRVLVYQPNVNIALNSTSVAAVTAALTILEKQDLDNRVPAARNHLLLLLRKDRTFSSLWRAFTMSNAKEDFVAAQGLAKSRADLEAFEQGAVKLVTNPIRLFNVEFRFDKAQIAHSHKENAGVFSMFSVWFNKSVSGTLALELARDSPIRPRYGNYDVTVDLNLTIPRNSQVRSKFAGNSDKPTDWVVNRTVTARLSPPNYRASVKVDFGTAEIAFFDRGSQGGHTLVSPTDDPTVTVRIPSVSTF
jgi:hypothetical protein